MRTHESGHKLWTATLNQMALINESVYEAIADLSNKRTTTKASSANHSDLSKSYRKILQRLPSCCVGLKIQLILTNLKTRLKCYRTQRVSYHRKRRNKDYVNAEGCFSVGTALQKELDGKSFIDKQ